MVSDEEPFIATQKAINFFTHSDQHLILIAFPNVSRKWHGESVNERCWSFTMEMNKAVVLFMNYCHSKSLRPKTMASYEQTLKLFDRWLQDEVGRMRIEDIKEVHIRQYIVDVQERGKYTACAAAQTRSKNYPHHRRDYKKKVSNITINNYIRNMRVFFNWMEEAELIMKSPMKKVRCLPAQRAPREFMDDDEVILLMRGMDKSYFSEYRDLLVMMLMLDSGTRLGETLCIEDDQLNVTEKSLYLPADKTKGRKERTVFFSQKTAKELRRWLQYRDRYCDSQYVFPVKSTGRMLKVSNFEANFRHYMERAGIEKHISPHTLRNNFAKRCLMAGMDVFTLSKILGHSSVSVTERAYLDVTDDDLRKRYSKFSPIDGIYYKNE